MAESRSGRILTLATFLTRAQAGAAHATVSIVNALARRGNDVHVACYELEAGLLDQNVNVTVLPTLPTPRGLWRLGRGPAVCSHRKAYRATSLPDCDFVYTQSVEMGLAYSSLFPSRRIVSHQGYIIAARESREENDAPWPWPLVDAFFAERFERKSYQLSNWTHVVSTQLVGDVRCEEFRLPRDFFVVQPLGIDSTLFAPSGIRSEVRESLQLRDLDCALITVARIVSWKNHLWTIRALDDLPENVIFLVLGDGPEKSNLESQIPDRLKSRVRFLGHTTPRPFLEAADLFVLPSRIESFGVAYAEAMSMGLPCIGLRYQPPDIISSAKEVIREGVTGFLAADFDEYRTVLANAVADPKRLAEMGAAARKHAVDVFDVSNYAEFLERRSTSKPIGQD